RGDVDTFTVYVVRLDDHVTKVDADPIPDPFRPWQLKVAPHHALLDDYGTANGFHRAVKHGKKPIASGLYEAPTMLDDGGVYQLTQEPLDARVRALLIGFHQ